MQRFLRTITDSPSSGRARDIVLVSDNARSPPEPVSLRKARRVGHHQRSFSLSCGGMDRMPILRECQPGGEHSRRFSDDSWHRAATEHQHHKVFHSHHNPKKERWSSSPVVHKTARHTLLPRDSSPNMPPASGEPGMWPHSLQRTASLRVPDLSSSSGLRLPVRQKSKEKELRSVSPLREKKKQSDDYPAVHTTLRKPVRQRSFVRLETF